MAEVQFVAGPDVEASCKESHMWEYCKGTADAGRRLWRAKELAVGSERVRDACTVWYCCCYHRAQAESAEPVGE